MKIITGLYTVYAVFLFFLLSLIYVPILLVLCQRKSWHHFALRIHTIWSWNYFILAFIRVKVVKKFKPEPKQQYIYCANHFSYMDIPAMLLNFQAKFIGKSSLSQIPIFGYFYRKIHITVDRGSMRSRADSLKKTKEALDDKFNLSFFPEGGVIAREEDLPQMVPFRNGAFILSIEKNIPIVPVTMPYNYKIIPDRLPFRVHPHSCKIIIHEPIYPRGNTDEDLKQLKNDVFNVIQNELNAHHPDKVRSVK